MFLNWQMHAILIKMQQSKRSKLPVLQSGGSYDCIHPAGQSPIFVSQIWLSLQNPQLDEQFNPHVPPEQAR